MLQIVKVVDKFQRQLPYVVYNFRYFLSMKTLRNYLRFVRIPLHSKAIVSFGVESRTALKVSNGGGSGWIFVCLLVLLDAAFRCSCLGSQVRSIEVTAVQVIAGFNTRGVAWYLIDHCHQVDGEEVWNQNAVIFQALEIGNDSESEFYEPTRLSMPSWMTMMRSTKGMVQPKWWSTRHITGRGP